MSNWNSGRILLPKKKNIAAIDLCLDSLKEYFVYYFNSFYKLNQLVKAIVICFKPFHVFNLKYPLESQLVLFYYQMYFYGILGWSGVNVNTFFN